MRHFKRFIHAILRFGMFTAYMWSATDEEREAIIAAHEAEEEDDEDEPDVEERERDAAYLTTGLITAARAIHKAHEANERCTPHHEASIALLSSIDNGVTAVRIIQHLLEIVAQTVDDEDVQRMVASIVATELGHDEDDNDDNHH